MSGELCSDYTATKMAEGLCLTAAQHPLGELYLYANGRVADIKEVSGDKVTFAGPTGQGRYDLEGVTPDSLENTRKMQGAEVGDCSAQGGSVSFEILPTDSGITWTAKDQIALSRIFGDRVGRAFLCSDPHNQGTIGINTSKAFNTQLIRGFKKLQSECSSLLGEGSADKCAALKGVANLYVPKGEQSTGEKIKATAIYILGGIFVFAVGGLAAHILGNWWNNRGGGPKPPSGGGGGANDLAAVASLLAALAAAANGLKNAPPSSPAPGSPPEGHPRVSFPSEPTEIRVTGRGTSWEEYAAGATILVATAFLLHKAGKGRAGGVVAEEGVMASFRRVASRYAMPAAAAAAGAVVLMNLPNDAQAAPNGGGTGTQVQKNKATLELYGGSE
ncbi:MAG TPA: hypothetical protein VLJ37_09700 [bacterium]|nr:hypothetical protein [bacterium]